MARLPILPFAAIITIMAITACSNPSALMLSNKNDAVPETTRQYQFTGNGEGPYEIALKTVPTPTVGPNDVVVRVRATSLNRRDHSLLNKAYGGGGNPAGGVPLSDGAGEVIAVGDEVTRFKIGDRVAGTFFSEWIDGKGSVKGRASARGAGRGGMLSEIVVSNENGLVNIPEHLSYEEAATLPCAALTAWVGLFKQGNLQADDFVLLEGTGGVSSFGLLFAAAAGAKPIITSSSNEKLAKARELGAIGTVNYRENEEWHVKVRELTGGAGVDHVLEIGGKDTINKAIQALGFGGHMALIGGVTGFAQNISVGGLMRSGGSATGIFVGSREDFEAMNEFITEHKIRPVIDRTFTFEQAPEAFEFMDSGSFMGKIVVTL